MGLDFRRSTAASPATSSCTSPTRRRSAAAAPSATWSGLGSYAIACPPILHMGNGGAEAALPAAGLQRTEDRRPGHHGARRRLRRGQHPHPAVRGRRPLYRQRRQDLHHQRLPANFITPRRSGPAGPASRGSACWSSTPSTPGFSVAKKIRKMGWNASDTAELAFEDCRVPAENLLGVRAWGSTASWQTSQNERLAGRQAHATAELAHGGVDQVRQDPGGLRKTLSGFQVTRHSWWTWPRRSPWPRNTTTVSRRKCRRASTASGSLHGEELRLRGLRQGRLRRRADPRRIRLYPGITWWSGCTAIPGFLSIGGGTPRS